MRHRKSAYGPGFEMLKTRSKRRKATCQCASTRLPEDTYEQVRQEIAESNMKMRKMNDETQEIVDLHHKITLAQLRREAEELEQERAVTDTNGRFGIRSPNTQLIMGMLVGALLFAIGFVLPHALASPAAQRFFE